MINFITRNFSSIWSLITWPFRGIWRLIIRAFPEQDFTIMNTPKGTVYSYHQSSFWRFTKFCGTFGLTIWAIWSTYVFMYHRPLLQKRTQQLEEVRTQHARQVSDLMTYLEKYNELARGLNVMDDRLLNARKLPQAEKDSLLKQRLNTWGELDFLRTKLGNIFVDVNYKPEFSKISELSAEYEITKSANEELRRQNDEITRNMLMIADADNQIIDTVTKMTTEKTDDLRKNLKKINNTVANLGLGEVALVERANKYSGQLVGAAFLPIQLDKDMDPKYQKLADNLELWHGLARLNIMLPLGAPVTKPHVTSTFGVRADPFNGAPKQHQGIDFAGKIGTELVAVAPGRVVSTGERNGYGKTVEVDHGLGFSTLYAHLSKISVSRGDWVRPGTVVGLGGSSGRSTGPHLHYEIRYNGAPFNPANFVKDN